jgi:hypothetical protein
MNVQGNLQWQNELNMLNKPFMDNCDGIFLNYIWKAPDLSSSFAGHQRHRKYFNDNILRRKTSYECLGPNHLGTKAFVWHKICLRYFY